VFQHPQLWNPWFKIRLSQGSTKPVPTIPTTKLFGLNKHNIKVLYEIKILLTKEEKFFFPPLNIRLDQ